MIKNLNVKARAVFSSLRLRFVVVFFAAVIVGVTSYALTHFLAYSYINTVYTSTENRKTREIEYIKDLQDFVVGNEISSENTSKLSDWASRNKYVYLLIYRNEELFYTSDDKPSEPEPEPEEDETVETPEDSETGEEDGAGEKSDEEGAETEKEEEGDKPSSDEPGGVTIEYPTREELFEYARKNDLHPLELADGTVFASLAEFTEYLYYDIANIASLLVAFLTVLIVCTIYFYFVINRIIRLGNEVNKVADGDVNHAVRFKGEDEISKLSVSVDIMRNSMIENFRKEREALDSNSALITSMSHDIRTPLTVLLGYIDVMSMKAADDEEMQNYLKAAESTAMRLKKLSDDMFGYFLVFGGRELEINMESYDAKTLIDQMLSEHILLMKESGYLVTMKEGELDALDKCSVHTDAQKLVRIFDNVFSNIYKYADKSAPVSISVDKKDGKIILIFSNKVLEKNVKTESNGIGLKTCKKLGEHIGVRFDTVNNGEIFEAHIVIETIEKR